MKFRKITTLITLAVLFVLVLIGLDMFTLTAKWRFYGRKMFYKNYSDMLPKSVKWGQSSPAGSAPSKKGMYPDSPYLFTCSCHMLHARDWENHLKELKGKPNIHALEIGSYEGLSAIWQLENILTDSTSTITCIDIFDDKVIEDRFDRNIQATGVAYKVIKLKGSSEKMLRGLKFEQYDHVYIDGSHMTKWVLSDAVLSWDLLKKGGLIIFDDYPLKESRPKEFRPTGINRVDNYLWMRTARNKTGPGPAIDAFLKIYGPYLELVFKKYQVVVKKL